MARNLFRFYLYTVFIAMLVFATVGLGRLLQTLLALTPLRGSYDARPLNSEIVQAVVFFLVSLVISSDRESTRLNSSHTVISYAVFFLKKKKKNVETMSCTTKITPSRASG